MDVCAGSRSNMALVKRQRDAELVSSDYFGNKIESYALGTIRLELFV